ncbi:hypothetical protein BJ170DRAFT_687881 [Xylariales sp. AK1849]|nr:hypothetical protein BJ170DRAFT_687881 [Xylariales sp. AK1849]
MSFPPPVPTVPNARLSKDVAGLQCFTKARNSHRRTLSVPRAACSSAVNSMSRSPSLEAIRTIISNSVPNVAIESIQPLPSSRPQRDIGVKVSDGRTFLFALPPSPMLRLLRSEQWLVLSETLVIRWVSRKVLEYVPKDERVSIRYLIEAEPRKGSPERPVNTKIDQTSTKSSKQSLLRYLPALITHASSDPRLGTAFSFSEPTRGSSIASLPEPLTAAEKKTTDFQKGQLVRRIASFASPNSRFGPAVAIIDSTPSRGSSSTPALVGSGGVETWTNAFLALVEGVLRDGEDASVMISYSSIRGHVRRLSHLLDAVTQSRLVVLDAGNDANVLVSRSTNPSESDRPVVAARPATKLNTTPQAIPRSKDRGTSRAKGKEKDTQDRHDGGSESHERTADSASEDEKSIEAPGIEITGLYDWSNCLFGDPLMTSIFSQDPSPNFLRGFQHPSHDSAAGRHAATPPDYDELVEDRENAPIRLLLYECYHAAVYVVKQFYRPSADSRKHEIAARRRLTSVLNKLAEVDETTGKRPRTASTEIWPVKKPRPDNGKGEGA